MFNVTLGNAVTQTARFVALWWDSRAIPDRHDVDLSRELQDVPSTSGVYAITGRHDAHAGQAVLYIGKASDLPSRIVVSVHDSLSEEHAHEQQSLPLRRRGAEHVIWRAGFAEVHRASHESTLVRGSG